MVAKKYTKLIYWNFQYHINTANNLKYLLIQANHLIIDKIIMLLHFNPRFIFAPSIVPTKLNKPKRKSIYDLITNNHY